MDTAVGLPIYRPEDITDELAATLVVRVMRLDRARLDALETWLDAGAPVPLLPARLLAEDRTDRA